MRCPTAVNSNKNQTKKKDTVTKEDVEEIDSLFYDAKASAKLLIEQQGLPAGRRSPLLLGGELIRRLRTRVAGKAANRH